jgi:hypothetical protein
MRRDRAFRALFAVLVTGSLVLGTAVVPAAGGGAIERTPGDAEYGFRLRSGQVGKAWRGTGSIAFTNTGSAPLPLVYLRTWSNGVLGCDAHSITVSNLRGGSITDERLDCTELEVTLDAPLGPGDRTTIEFDLHVRLPNEDDRFGFHRGLALAGTALPTLAVHDDRGWHRMPFENLGESFYSMASDYEVTFTTPRELDTAATGAVIERVETGHGRVRTTYAATQVRDFAWAAGDLRTVMRDARGIDVVVWYQPGVVARATADALARDAADVIRTLGHAFGAYPYPEIDVVVAGNASFGGMEYPTIVFSVPRRITVAHELAHQWFYGTVGNDQYREPWLDESFATWAMRLPFDPRAGCRGISWPSKSAAFTNDMGYWSTHRSEYGLVYYGGACMLANLSKRFGHDRFLRVIGRYTRRHHLGIARTEDFMAAIEAAAAKHLSGFEADAYWRRWRVSPA